MPDAATRGDSVRLYLSGAASAGAAQADPDASLGKYRSSSEVLPLAVAVEGGPANVELLLASGANGAGQGTLSAPTADTLRWKPPGGAQGPAVEIANGETKVLEAGGDDGPSAFVRVARNSTADLAGTATVTLGTPVHGTVGFADPTAAEAAAGDDTVRIVVARNDHASATVTDVRLYVPPTVGAETVDSDAGQLGAAGSGTLETTGAFAGWPQSGGCAVYDADGDLREIVYFASRTDTALTVPTAGRGLLGTSAGAGAADDVLWSVPLVRLAFETSAPYTDFTADDHLGGYTPTSGWTVAHAWETGMQTGDLASGGEIAVVVHRHIPAGAAAAARVLQGVALWWVAP